MRASTEDEEEAVANDRFNNFIASLLSILGNTASPGAQTKLKKAFRGGCVPGKIPGTETLITTILERRQYAAIGYLLSASTKKTVPQNPLYKKFIKKITRLRDALKESADLLVDDEVQIFIKDMANRNGEVSAATVMKFYKEAFEHNKKLAIELSFFLHEPNIAKGRPSFTALYEYILELAHLFEQVSSLPFSIYRHGADNAQGKRVYTPVTVAHTFVAEAVRYINEMAIAEGSTVTYTDKNIYNACEAAQKQMRQERVVSSKK